MAVSWLHPFCAMMAPVARSMVVLDSMAAMRWALALANWLMRTARPSALEAWYE